MKPKPILFHPKYEIGDEVFIIHKNEWVQAIIDARRFIDYGEIDMDDDDPKTNEMYDSNIIDTEPGLIREIKIQYRLDVGYNEYVKRDEDDIYLSINYYIKTLKIKHGNK